MQLTNQTFQTILNMQNFATPDAPAERQAALVAKATEVLEILHTIESIERVANLSGAIALIERSAKTILRVLKAPTPKYKPHAIMVDDFLSLDFANQSAVASGKLPKTTDHELAKLFG